MYLSQRVSDIGHFVIGSGLITSFPTYDQQEVSDIAHFGKAVLSYLSLWPTVCKWHHGTCCERHSCQPLLLWPIASKWHWTSYERRSHHIFSHDQQEVSDSRFCEKSLITSFPVTNRKWVTLHILWMSASSHLFLSPTACEWHHNFYELYSHHTSIHECFTPLWCISESECITTSLPCLPLPLLSL